MQKINLITLIQRNINDKQYFHNIMNGRLCQRLSFNLLFVYFSSDLKIMSTLLRCTSIYFFEQLHVHLLILLSFFISFQIYKISYKVQNHKTTHDICKFSKCFPVDHLNPITIGHMKLFVNLHITYEIDYLYMFVLCFYVFIYNAFFLSQYIKDNQYKLHNSSLAK